MTADPIALLRRARRRARLRAHDRAATSSSQKLELEEEDIESLLERLETHGIELTDDCSRAIEEEVTYTNQQIASATTDSLQLFLNEAGRYPLLTAAQEVELAKRIERRRQAGEGPARQLEPAARRLDREEVPGPRADAARPDPGGDHRADPRRREVRLAQGLQVLDVRDVVDPPGGAARRREQGAHDPHPGAHRRARAEDLARRARARREARARADRRGGRARRRSCRSSRCARCARPRARSRRSTSRSARTTRRRSATCSRARRRTPDEQVEVELTEQALHDGGRRAVRARAADPHAALRPRAAPRIRSRSRRSAASSASRASGSASSRRRRCAASPSGARSPRSQAA